MISPHRRSVHGKRHNMDKAIGIFDSGVGGLTVLNEILKVLPHENTAYLGDTARIPYGTKSPVTVTRYARQIASFLVKHDIKLLVVACNTASALSLSVLTSEFSIPIVGVIEPGSRRAAAVTRNGKVGVIGTEATIRSEAYPKAIHALDPDIAVVTRACPLFVPLAEEGWVDNEVARLAARTYLKGLREAEVDTMVLGCTHYPLLRGVISEVMGEGVTLVDSGQETARSIAETLRSRGMLRASPGKVEHRFYVTDVPDDFIRVANRFLDERLDEVRQVRLEDDRE